MARIKIIRSDDQRKVALNVNGKTLSIPVDGAFHTVPDALLPPLDDSAVEYETENVSVDSGAASAPLAGAVDGLGGSSTALPSKAKAALRKLKKKLKS